MDQKWPNSDFQPQNSMSNIDLIHLKMIFYIEYWISRTFFIIDMLWLIHFWKALFSKKGPIFVKSRTTQNKTVKKTICWHQLFRQKWAFSRLVILMFSSLVEIIFGFACLLGIYLDICERLKTVCWHQLFRQKWAFSRLSTSVLHKCGHITPHNQLQNFF